MSFIINPFALAGGGGVLVTDSFNRADNASSLGSTDTGQAWSAHGTWSILSNLARVVSFGTSPSVGVAWIESGGFDGIVQVTFSTWNNDICLMFRLTDANNYLALTYNGGSGWRVVKREAGTLGTVASFAGAIANGDVMEITLSGSSISVDRNGSLLGATTSAFNQTATKHGLAAHANTGHRWNDFSYTP